MKTAETSPTGYGLITFLALIVTLGISGCSQTSRWLARNSADHSATVAATPEDKDESAFATFDSPDTPTLHYGSASTGFVAVSDHSVANGVVGPLVPPAAPPVPSLSSDFQFTKFSTPRQSLIALGPADSLHDEINNASGVVVVDFYADWCGPCRRQGAILHDMESQAGLSNATIIKVNIDEHRELARKYNVSSLPTLIAVKDGDVLRRQVGLASESIIASMLRL